MYWLAFMPIQLAADIAPKGARHSRKGPETRSARGPLGPPCPCVARIANVDSQTVRKQSTWRQSPEATAMAAGVTRPPRPGRAPPPVAPGRVDAEGFFNGARPPLAHPPSGGPGIRRQAVDVVEGQPGIGDRLEAGIDGKCERVDHEATAERGAADTTQHRLVFEPLLTEGGPGERPPRLLDSIDRV